MYNLDDYVIWTTFEGVNVHDPQSFSHGSLFLGNKKKRKDIFVQPSDLSSISFPSSNEGVCEIGKDPTTIFMGW